MKRSSQSGISLLELLVTLAIFSILSAMAAPSVQALIQNNRARAITDEFTSSLYRTRSEAVKRSNPVTMCASNPAQTSCTTDTADDFSGGWIIFTDYDNDQTLDPVTTTFDTSGDGVADSPEEILFVSGVPEGNIQIAANVGTRNRVITYRSNGLVDRGSGTTLFSYLLSDTATTEQVSRLYMGMTGRVRQCVGDVTKCPDP